MPVDPRLGEISDCLYRVGAKAIIIRGGKILLVREKDGDWWNIPGGGIDYGETAEQALRRELTEELGISGDVVMADGQIAFAALSAVVNGIPKANLYYKVEVSVDKITPSDHVAAANWFSVEELPGLRLSPASEVAVQWVSAMLRS